MCNHCESNTRKIWGPDKRDLNLEITHGGNWINLEKCTKCNTYWVYSAYEPYCAFPYWVKWELSPDRWKEIHDLDEGNLIHQCHIFSIKQSWQNLSQAEIEFINAHRERSYRFHNPIDLPIEDEDKIEKLLNPINYG